MRMSIRKSINIIYYMSKLKGEKSDDCIKIWERSFDKISINLWGENHSKTEIERNSLNTVKNNCQKIKLNVLLNDRTL